MHLDPLRIQVTELAAPLSITRTRALPCAGPGLKSCRPRCQVPGARVVLLKDLTKAQVLDYYRRAKINLDTYLTGRERALFEGALFNVIPVIKHHSSGVDQKVTAVAAPPLQRAAMSVGVA